MSQSLWQIGRPDLNAFFFLSSRYVKFKSVTTLFSMKYGTWFFDQQDARQNTELKKFVVQNVLLCLSCLFMYILTSKLIKNRKKKKLSKQINKRLNFAESNAHPKTNARGSFETYNLFFFSLIICDYILAWYWNWQNNTEMIN